MASDAAPPPGYALQSNDSEFAAERLQIDRWRSLDAAGKADLFQRWSSAVHEVHLAGLHRRWPAATDAELELRAASIRHGAGVVREAPLDPGRPATGGHDVLRAATDAAALFEQAGVPYALAGGMASILYGEPRSTLDVDFVVHMAPVHAGRIAALCSGTFLLAPGAALEAVQASGMFCLVHTADYVKVDVHVTPREGLHRLEIERARWVRLSRNSLDEVRVVTPEDVVIQKLRWFRLGGEISDKQWRDVLGVLKVCGDVLDLEYVGRWCDELGVRDLLGRALTQSGLS